MSKSAHFNKEAQDALVKGINLVANAVKTTLGYAGNSKEEVEMFLNQNGL